MYIWYTHRYFLCELVNSLMFVLAGICSLMCLYVHVVGYMVCKKKSPIFLTAVQSLMAMYLNTKGRAAVNLKHMLAQQVVRSILPPGLNRNQQSRRFVKMKTNPHLPVLLKVLPSRGVKLNVYMCCVNIVHVPSEK